MPNKTKKISDNEEEIPDDEQYMSFDDSVVGYSTSATAAILNFNSDCGPDTISKQINSAS